MHFFLVCSREGWRGLRVQCLSVVNTTRWGCSSFKLWLEIFPLQLQRNWDTKGQDKIDHCRSMVEVAAVAPCSSAWFTPAHSPSRHNLEFSVITGAGDKTVTEPETFSIISLSSSHKHQDDRHSRLGDLPRTNIKKIERFVWSLKYGCIKQQGKNS